ncbi:oxidoreductase alpha molybdopterin subunit, putative [Babesia ovis]|uniref:Oxidoreductase alpha molybdopterin subunit, putative n=1 Tax=Babesia ovis TaxID=5869 RepID=A0A9W5TC90_BABOV|nr:oxidoreductase alpha molybdopterin subunit, putative [Babesia ovis]
MLFVSRVRALWVKLPSDRCNSSDPMLLHLFSAGSKAAGIDATFSNDPGVKRFVKKHKIKCYTHDVSHLPLDVLTRLGIKTVPVVVGVYRGRNLGEFTTASASSCAPELCKKLIDAQTLDIKEQSKHAALAEQIDGIIAGKSKAQALAELSKFEASCMQQLEVDDVLRRVLARKRLELYWANGGQQSTSGRATLDRLRDHLAAIEQLLLLFEKASADDLIFAYSNVAVSGLPRGSQMDHALSCGGSTATSVVNQLDKFIAENGYALEGSTGITRARLVKIGILQDLSVGLFLEDNIQEALQEATRGYEELVKMLKNDEIPTSAFENHAIGGIIELMFSALPWDDPSVQIARATLETVDGPRHLNRIPESTRPLGGPAYKRRGFRGRYSWQGPDYRPKKYRPRDPEQYLNEWRYQPDANLPTY